MSKLLQFLAPHELFIAVGALVMLAIGLWLLHRARLYREARALNQARMWEEYNEHHGKADQHHRAAMAIADAAWSEGRTMTTAERAAFDRHISQRQTASECADAAGRLLDRWAR